MTRISHIGSYRHFVTFENPGDPVPDGDGGFTQGWSVVASMKVSIAPATARGLETISMGTVLSMASHIVVGRFHPDVSTQTRMLYDGRTFSITAVANVEERSVTMQLVAVEVV